MIFRHHNAWKLGSVSLYYFFVDRDAIVVDTIVVMYVRWVNMTPIWNQFSSQYCVCVCVSSIQSITPSSMWITFGRLLQLSFLCIKDGVFMLYCLQKLEFLWAFFAIWRSFVLNEVNKCRERGEGGWLFVFTMSIIGGEWVMKFSSLHFWHFSLVRGVCLSRTFFLLRIFFRGVGGRETLVGRETRTISICIWNGSFIL